jgi:hypothetical protein
MLPEMDRLQMILRGLVVIAGVLLISHAILIVLLLRTRSLYSVLEGEARGWRVPGRATRDRNPRLMRETALIRCAYKLNAAATSAERENALAELSMHVERLRSGSQEADGTDEVQAGT